MKRHMMKSLAILAIVGLLGGSVPPATAQQQMTVYTTLDESVAREVFKEFEVETGIRAEWIRLSTGKVVTQLEAERANPKAGIWVGGVDNGHINAKEKGLTAPYTSPQAEAIPAKFRDLERYWTGLYAGPLAFASNVTLLKKHGLKAPASWADLLKPEYRGHIQTSNPNSSGTAQNVITTLIFLWGEEKAFAYLKDLHKNVSMYTDSGSAPPKAAARGETAIGIGYAHSMVRLKAEGAPIEITLPSEGTGYEIASVSLVKNGPQPELAKKLYDWVLSRRAAEIYAKYFFVPLIDVPLKPGAIPIAQVKTVNQDSVWAGKNAKRLLEKWNAERFVSR